MMNDVFEHLDDLVVVAGKLDRPHTFTLTAIVRNEMHFLPVFLSHYRALGVDRFIVIDDQSDDGTLAYLAKQPDVVVLKSNWRFGHKLTLEEAGCREFAGLRMMSIWRNLLLRKYCMNVWSLHLDVDEFLDLPAGMSIGEFTARLNGTDINAVWSVMLDMYPAQVDELLAMANDTIVDFNRPWYFDGRRHMRLRRDKVPRVIYAGVRARLLNAHDLNPKADWFDRKIAPRFGISPKNFNNIRKPALLRWHDDAGVHRVHSVGAKASETLLLPIRHYKFNGSIAQRIKRATDTGCYADDSSEYVALEQLLIKMKQENKPFRGRNSRRYEGFEDFKQTGNALGFD